MKTCLQKYIALISVALIFLHLMPLHSIASGGRPPPNYAPHEQGAGPSSSGAVPPPVEV